MVLSGVSQLPDVGDLLRLVAAHPGELVTDGMCALTPHGGPLQNQLTLDHGSCGEDPDNELRHLPKSDGVDAAVQGSDVKATIKHLGDPADGLLHRPAMAGELRQYYL